MEFRRPGGKLYAYTRGVCDVMGRLPVREIRNSRDPSTRGRGGPLAAGCMRTTEYTRPVATGGIVETIFSHNFPKNDAQDLKKWSRKTRPVFLYNL